MGSGFDSRPTQSFAVMSFDPTFDAAFSNDGSFCFDSVNSGLENTEPAINSGNADSYSSSNCATPDDDDSVYAKQLEDSVHHQAASKEPMNESQKETEQASSAVVFVEGDCEKRHLAEIARLKGYLIELDQEITFEAERTNRRIKELETQMEHGRSSISNEERDRLLDRIRELETGNDNLQEALLMLQARMSDTSLKHY